MWAAWRYIAYLTLGGADMKKRDIIGFAFLHRSDHVIKGKMKPKELECIVHMHQFKTCSYPLAGLDSLGQIVLLIILLPDFLDVIVL